MISIESRAFWGNYAENRENYGLRPEWMIGQQILHSHVVCVHACVQFSGDLRIYPFRRL